MKRRSIETTLAVLVTVACLNLVGCSGIIKPDIGESGIASATEETTADGAAAGETDKEMLPAEGEGPGGAGEQSGSGAPGSEEGAGGPGGEEGPGGPGGGEGPGGFGGMGAQESEPRPEMSGEVQTRFATSKQTSNGLGQTMTLSATVELYDAENAEGYNALIAVKLDETEKYTPCTWKEENGEYILAIDEFTNYESKEVEGVQTIVGVRYEFGMEGKGTIDIPIEDEAAQPENAAQPADAEEVAPAKEAGEETEAAPEPAGGEAE